MRPARRRNCDNRIATQEFEINEVLIAISVACRDRHERRCVHAADLRRSAANISGDGQSGAERRRTLGGGAIYFRCPRHAPLEAIGEIGADGNFQLYTMAEGKRCEGAVAGVHEVTRGPAARRRTSCQRPFSVAQTYEVEAQPNELTITLPK